VGPVPLEPPAPEDEDDVDAPEVVVEVVVALDVLDVPASIDPPPAPFVPESPKSTPAHPVSVAASHRQGTVLSTVRIESRAPPAA
jgi:hypothetical protein